MWSVSTGYSYVGVAILILTYFYCHNNLVLVTFNKYMMAVDVIYRPDLLLARIQSALDKVDVLVTSGGVSMGEKVPYLN